VLVVVPDEVLDVVLAEVLVVLAPAVDGRLTTKPDSTSRATSNRDRLIIRLTACTTLPTRSPDRVVRSVDRSH
jgi:hypothetical protein